MGIFGRHNDEGFFANFDWCEPPRCDLDPCQEEATHGDFCMIHFYENRENMKEFNLC